MKTFMPHQQLAYNWASERDCPAFFMEMRLGKSLPALRWGKEVSQDNLILAPKAALPGWKEELLDEGVKPIDIVELVEDTQTRYNIASLILKRKNNKQKWYLTNYEGMSQNLNMFKIDWPLIIADESTKFKNPQSDISEALVKYTRKTKYKTILSGCPRPEGELDYVQQMLFLHGEFMGETSYWDWRKKYCIQDRFNWSFNEYFRKELDRYLSQYTFTLTRKNAGMGEKKVREKRYVEMTEAQKAMYEKIEKDFEYGIQQKETTKWAAVKYGWMMRVAGGFSPNLNNLGIGKYTEILNLIRGELKGESIVIWFRFNEELEGLRFWFNKLGIGYAVYTGEEKLGEDRFKRGEVKYMLAQPKAASMALDWSVADTEIYYSNWPDGEIRIQSEDRIVNVRKKVPRLYIDLVCKGTIDEDVVDLVNDKKENSESVMNRLNKRMVERYENRTSGKAN